MFKTISWCLIFFCLAMPSTSVMAQTAAGPLLVLPEGGRSFYTEAIARARRDIRIEICVLQDPQILQALQTALGRGVRVRAIVDQAKYLSTPATAIDSEAANLTTYFTAAGGELHLSNPIFPRSFPKIILIDNREVILGSACLDSTTFKSYRDFATHNREPAVLESLTRLFENDWAYTTPPGVAPPPFNPTPKGMARRLLIAPVNAAVQMVSLYQRARKSLDVYSEILGNTTLESELAAAVARGVKVRLITPLYVNNMPQATQDQQKQSIIHLKSAGVEIHVNGTEHQIGHPYLHARAAIVDGREAYLGSISLSPDSITFNREAGLLLADPTARRQLAQQFELDFRESTYPY